MGRILETLKAAAGGGLAGAAVGGLKGLMFMGPFGLLPGMVMGGTFGAGAGALAGLFMPRYDQMMNSYNPAMLNYANTSQFGGLQMPQFLMGNNYNGNNGRSGVGSFGVGAGVGALAALFGGSALACFSYPMFGLGWGGVWGGHSFGFGGFDWGPNVWKGLGWPLGW